MKGLEIAVLAGRALMKAITGTELV